ncbi:MAG: polyphosphate kinase 2 family protein [Thiothrix sp.]|nr:polyphosphate kinase 2 family protein [Thiothrix sp.]HPE59073.1 polyphosphate kinase 2 family protein [Thiolinea sp.]
MFEFPRKHQVPFDGSFRLKDAATRPDKEVSDKALEQRLKKLSKKLEALQRIFYARDSRALLLIFQAMDAAGKDGTIRAIMKGIDPAGCQVFSFKQPSAEELDHDFLWRTTCRLPERGRIGIFNRSYYEEVLVVRVHPEYLAAQRLPRDTDRDLIWEERFESIRHHEQHLARNGTIILKFWLNISAREQKSRFLERLDKPEKNWKFSPADVAERQHWHDYMHAYEEALNATSRLHAPWYAIPADNKKFMRVAVAETLVQTLESLSLEYPEASDADLKQFAEARRLLEAETD